ncbi:hypothetical protein [Clostridium botulinum]
MKNLTDNLHLIEDVKKDVKEVKDVLLRTS